MTDMDELVVCSGCGGFMNAGAAACPHCDVRPSPGRRRRWAVLLGLAGSASLGLTLMACYGAPVCREPGPNGCVMPQDSGGVDTRSDAGAPD